LPISTFILLSLFQLSSAAFDLNAKDNMILFWGQNSKSTDTSQQRLKYYCDPRNVDMVIISFISQFPFGSSSNAPTLNFANACDSSSSFNNGLLKCDEIAQDISYCQNLGIPILLSLGGSAGGESYGFDSDDEAAEFALTLWNLFGEGESNTRPFGDAVIDGFDLDIENKDQTGYPTLVSELRSYFKSSLKKYYISATPQCPYPDESLGDVLIQSDIDFALIQFYNNYCNIGTDYFNFDQWVQNIQNFNNKDIKLYLTLAAAESAASFGYVSSSIVAQTLDQISSYSSFGGVSLWDASQAYTNQENGLNFVQQVNAYLKSNQQSPSQPQSQSQPTISSDYSLDSTSTITPPSSSSFSPISTDS
ncbi:chitinase, partial [Ascoidea rubescens DSM 1968]